MIPIELLKNPQVAFAAYRLAKASSLLDEPVLEEDTDFDSLIRDFERMKLVYQSSNEQAVKETINGFEKTIKEKSLLVERSLNLSDEEAVFLRKAQFAAVEQLQANSGILIFNKSVCVKFLLENKLTPERIEERITKELAETGLEKSGYSIHIEDQKAIIDFSSLDEREVYEALEFLVNDIPDNVHILNVKNGQETILNDRFKESKTLIKAKMAVGINDWMNFFENKAVEFLLGESENNDVISSTEALGKIEEMHPRFKHLYGKWESTAKENKEVFNWGLVR